MSLTTGKVAIQLLEKAMETFEHQMQLLNLVSVNRYSPSDLQNAGNVLWRKVQQHAKLQSGWDLSNQEQGIIQETYPCILGTPVNDFIKLRADDMRDMSYWDERGMESGRQQATDLNKAIAAAIATQGSLFYRSNATSGYDFIAEAQAMMNERQLKNSGRSFILNDRTNLAFGKDLAGRQTVQGQPDNTWKTGQIGNNVAEFDVYTGSYLPNLAGGASPGTTVTGDQSFAPEAGSVNTSTGIVTNVDYRIASIPVAASASYNVGDKVQFENGGTPVYALALADKTSTAQAMTFTIVGKPDATTIQVYPKPIAADDPALSTTELGYANIDTQILNAAVVVRLNTAASEKTNLFFDKSAVEVMGGEIPAMLMKDFAGFKVISDTLSNGLTMYVVYDGNIEDMSFRARCFLWYGITVGNPSNCGCATNF